MKYLLDTHAFLWCAAEPEKLSSKVLGIVKKRLNKLYLSSASAWETTVLWRLEKLELPADPMKFIPEALRTLDVIPSPIVFSTAIMAAMLPFHHRDPFDRIIIAEAIKEDMIVLTKDAKFSAYGVKTLW